MIEELNKETLTRLYIKEKRPLRDIAEIFGCSYTLVRQKCLQYRIPLRPKNSKLIEFKKSVLLRLYVQEDKPPRKIAQMFSCTSATVRNRLRQYGIPIKDYKVTGLNKAQLQKLYVDEVKSIHEIAKIIGCSHETVRKRCMQHGIKLRPTGNRIMGVNKSALQRLFVKEGKSLSKIAEMFSCSPPTVRSRCREYGIKIRAGRPGRIKKQVKKI